VTVIVSGALVLALVVVGVYGLIAGPRTGVADPASSPAPATSAATTPATSVLPGLPVTADPVAYAQAVAAGLFTWDTASGHVPADYLGVLLAGAAPGSEEANGLASDIRAYLPGDTIWAQLRDYQTSQHLTGATAIVPDSWAGIAASAGTLLQAGTVAITVDATRVRDGSWVGEAVHSEHPVSFTVFAACTDACKLLRLSALGTPLR